MMCLRWEECDIQLEPMASCHFCQVAFGLFVWILLFRANVENMVQQKVKILKNQSQHNEFDGIAWKSNVIMLEELIVPPQHWHFFQFYPLESFCCNV